MLSILLLRRLVAAALLGALAITASAADSPSPRERLSLDSNWKFHLGNEWGIAQNLAKAGTGSGPASRSFGDASWRTVNLPHDWAVELPFDPRADGSHGFKALGPAFPSNSVAWYRRAFELPASDAGKRLWLEFDGVFRDTTVFVNGWFVGHHEGGYNSFRYDITDLVTPGEKNVIAVKVDATQFEGWFYEGAGIYRHVWLVKTGPVAIAPDGIFVRSELRTNDGASGPNKLQAPLYVETRVMNSQKKSVQVKVNCAVFDDRGKEAENDVSTNLPAWSENTIPLETWIVWAPKLWTPETPNLYKLVSTVEVDGQVVDRLETMFGIRTVAFDKDKGFLLNGQPYVLKGTCNHQDHAGVGAALPDALQYFRIARLKEMGCNAYRTSHNPPTPELLDACDRLGMLIMDENRLLGSDEENLRRWDEQIRRDRNHPSVAIWSIANEEFSTQATPTGARVAATMQAFVKNLDPTRPVTYAANLGNEFTNTINSVIQVRGWNYHIGESNMDAYHAAHPEQPNVGTEQGSTVGTRGIYTNDPARGYVSAYDDNKTEWSNLAQEWWGFFAPRPWLSGGFVWTGFDYRGEPTPYSWPCINSHFGILDTCGFPKDNFWYYQAWWTARPVLHLLPHWNWPGREGQEIDVRALSNCEEVELFLNGRSLGKKAMPKNSELKWQVNYAPGTLSARGYNDAKTVAETKVETTGAPAAIRLTPDRAVLNANGTDVSVFAVAVTDAQGRVVPVADNLVHFELAGPGKIIGVGNGDPSCHEPDVFLPRFTGHSMPLNDGWRWKKLPSVYGPDHAEFKTGFDNSAWAVAEVTSSSGPLGAAEQAVFRRQLLMNEADLANPAVELRCSMVDEEGWLYVNGKLVGETRDWQVPAVFDVKPFLHPGENTLAIAVANWNGAGGLNKGVTLEFQDPPVEPAWQRSVFNGLAQILVQSTRQPGEIKLTARADGLTPASVSLQSQPCPPPPALP